MWECNKGNKRNFKQIYQASKFSLSAADTAAENSG